MSMPQVHMLASCTGLGFGAEMLSVMLGTGIASRLISGWMSGVTFDPTGSYQAAFINGAGFNLLNLLIGRFLLRRAQRRGQGAGTGAVNTVSTPV